LIKGAIGHIWAFGATSRPDPWIDRSCVDPASAGINWDKLADRRK